MTNTGRNKMSIREFVNDLLGNSADSAIIPLATKYGMVGGSSITALGWLISAEGAIVIGVFTTIGGFIVNYIFQRRRDKRHHYESLQRETRMAELHELTTRKEKVLTEIAERQLKRLHDEQ